MDNEKKTERSLVRAIQQKGGLCIKLLPFLFKGLPDRLCLLPGAVIFFVEVKSLGEKPTKLQRNILDKIGKLGFKTYVIDSKEEVKQIIEELC